MSSDNSIHNELLSQFVATKRSLGGEEVANDGDAKIAKVDGDQNDVSLKGLQFTRILKVSPSAKRICIECLYKDEPAVVILEKTPFDEEITKHIVANFGERRLKCLFQNDVFGSYMDIDHQITIIHPARSKDIEKYVDHPYHFVLETAELYESVSKPFIEKQVNTAGHLQWVYNILEHKAETDRIVYEENLDTDHGFILVKDMKWKCDKEQLSELEKSEIYINAFVIRRDLHSLRDLTAQHLPMLEAIYNRGRKAIADKFSVDEHELRVFIHYQPSFYHLHVHFTHIKAEHGGFQAERAHMLATVIENIRLFGDYYQRVAIEFTLSSAAELKRDQFNQKQQQKLFPGDN